MEFDKFLEVFLNKDLEYIKEEKIYDFYKEIFNEIITKENVSLSDIKVLSGKNSSVCIVGNKVIKSGEKHAQIIPYHKRILQPIIRNVIELINEPKVKYYKKQIFSFFEVYEKVDTNNITEDDVYFIFKEMLHDNILWTDPRKENVGRLLKPNLPYVYNSQNISGKNYYIDDETVGIVDNDKKEMLNSGELVITDIDLIYKIKVDNLVETIKRMIITIPNINPSILLYNIYFVYGESNNQDFIIGKYLDKYLKRYMDEIKKELNNEVEVKK